MRRTVLALTLAASSAQAADIELGSRVATVTVFPDGALVTREAALDLPAGASSLILKGLPASVDPASIRVEGAGTSGFEIVSVDTRRVAADPAARPELDAKIQLLRDRLAAISGSLEAAKVKKAAIERYAQASPEKLGPEAKPLDPAQWQVAWDAVGAGLARVHAEMADLQVKIRDTQAEIRALEASRQRPKPGLGPTLDAVVAVDAPLPAKARLSISYRVREARWKPAYDARLSTGSTSTAPKLELVHRAVVTQWSGEAWTGVAVQLSTARVTGRAAAPDLPAWQVSFFERPLPRPAAGAERLKRAPAQGRDEEAMPAAPMIAAEMPKAEEARERDATLEAGAYQAVFSVPGKVDVAADGQAKTLRLAASSIDPALTVRTAPAFDPGAYLVATFAHAGEAPLLPGEVVLQRDGVMVGKTELKLVPPGETVELGFGADDRIKVTRVPVTRRESEPGWLGSTKSDAQEFRTVVKNLHARPVRVTLTDRMPFSEADAIQVELRRAEPKPTAENVEGRRGVMAWALDIPAGEERTVTFGWRVKWPADREITFRNGAIVPFPGAR